MPTLSAVGKKAQRFLPLTYRTSSPQHVLNLGSLTDWPAGYFPTNPSILKHPDGFLVCVRGVNYVLENERTMKPRFTDDNHYRTVNRFLLVSSDFTRVRALPHLDRMFTNIEDVKLFAFDGQIYGIGSRILNAAENSCCMTLGKIASDLNNATLRDISSPFGLRQEKNWSPFVHDGNIYFLYSYHPLIVVKYRLETGCVEFCNPEHAIYPPRALSFLICGSSSGFETPDGYLFVAHRRSVRLPSLRRAYVSRLYHLNRHISEVTAGPYFVIERPRIQFINGFLMDERAVYVSYGDNDNSAHLACFDPAEFAQLLPRRRERSRGKGGAVLIEQPSG